MRFILVVPGASTMCPSAFADYQRPDIPLRPAHTFSIVARDPTTGALGAAVQSHWFSVGSLVIWAEPGIGAVATQSFVKEDYGPDGLALMRAGKSAPDALAELLAKDSHSNVRQVGMVDADGHVAAHTGDMSVDYKCHLCGDNFTVQANMMHYDTVCTAMKSAFESATGDLAERMMQALEAAQAAGGDIRGKQSAAMIVVKGDKNLPAWGGREIDLRVDDDEAPIRELRRLLHVARTYQKMSEGDLLMENGKTEEALAAYHIAEQLSPDNHEAIFWHAATLAAIGQVEESLPLFTRAHGMQPNYKEMVQRLPASDLLPKDPELMSKILAVMNN